MRRSSIVYAFLKTRKEARSYFNTLNEVQCDRVVASSRIELVCTPKL